MSHDVWMCGISCTNNLEIKEHSHLSLPNILYLNKWSHWLYFFQKWQFINDFVAHLSLWLMLNLCFSKGYGIATEILIVFFLSILLFISLIGTFHWIFNSHFSYLSPFIINQIYSFILHTYQNFPSKLSFHSHPSSPWIPIHSLSISVQNRAGFSWMSTKCGISSWGRTKILPL